MPEEYHSDPQEYIKDTDELSVEAYETADELVEAKEGGDEAEIERIKNELHSMCNQLEERIIVLFENDEIDVDLFNYYQDEINILRLEADGCLLANHKIAEDDQVTIDSYYNPEGAAEHIVVTLDKTLVGIVETAKDSAAIEKAVNDKVIKGMIEPLLAQMKADKVDAKLIKKVKNDLYTKLFKGLKVYLDPYPDLVKGLSANFLRDIYKKAESGTFKRKDYGGVEQEDTEFTFEEEEAGTFKGTDEEVKQDDDEKKEEEGEYKEGQGKKGGRMEKKEEKKEEEKEEDKKDKKEELKRKPKKGKIDLLLISDEGEEPSEELKKSLYTKDDFDVDDITYDVIDKDLKDKLASLQEGMESITAINPLQRLAIKVYLSEVVEPTYDWIEDNLHEEVALLVVDILLEGMNDIHKMLDDPGGVINTTAAYIQTVQGVVDNINETISTATGAINYLPGVEVDTYQLSLGDDFAKTKKIFDYVSLHSNKIGEIIDRDIPSNEERLASGYGCRQLKFLVQIVVLTLEEEKNSDDPDTDLILRLEFGAQVLSRVKDDKELGEVSEIIKDLIKIVITDKEFGFISEDDDDEDEERAEYLSDVDDAIKDTLRKMGVRGLDTLLDIAMPKALSPSEREAIESSPLGQKLTQILDLVEGTVLNKISDKKSRLLVKMAIHNCRTSLMFESRRDDLLSVIKSFGDLFETIKGGLGDDKALEKAIMNTEVLEGIIEMIYATKDPEAPEIPKEKRLQVDRLKTIVEGLIENVESFGEDTNSLEIALSLIDSFESDDELIGNWSKLKPIFSALLGEGYLDLGLTDDAEDALLGVVGIRYESKEQFSEIQSPDIPLDELMAGVYKQALAETGINFSDETMLGATGAFFADNYFKGYLLNKYNNSTLDLLGLDLAASMFTEDIVLREDTILREAEIMAELAVAAAAKVDSSIDKEALKKQIEERLKKEIMKQVKANFAEHFGAENFNVLFSDVVSGGTEAVEEAGESTLDEIGNFLFGGGEEAASVSEQVELAEDSKSAESSEKRETDEEVTEKEETPKYNEETTKMMEKYVKDGVLDYGDDEMDIGLAQIYTDKNIQKLKVTWVEDGVENTVVLKRGVPKKGKYAAKGDKPGKEVFVTEDNDYFPTFNGYEVKIV